MKYFSIIIPMYNEEKNVLPLLDDIEQAINKEIYQIEVIIIDDGSSDKTSNVLKENLKRYSYYISLINHKKNLGQSRSIYSGIKASQYNTIVTIDGDCQNNPSDIPKLVDIYFSNDECDLVAGIRTKRNDNIIKILSSKLANTIRKKILKDGCDDTGCSLKVLNKEKFKLIPYFNGIHRFIPALYKGLNCKIIFESVGHRKRNFGKSKYGIYNRLFKGINDLIKVYMIIKNMQKK